MILKSQLQDIKISLPDRPQGNRILLILTITPTSILPRAGAREQRGFMGWCFQDCRTPGTAGGQAYKDVFTAGLENTSSNPPDTGGEMPNTIR